MEDRTLYLLYKRHRRLLDDYLRALYGNHACEGVFEELQVVDKTIWLELMQRGFSKESIDVKVSYDDQNSIFVLIYLQLDARFHIKT